MSFWEAIPTKLRTLSRHEIRNHVIGWTLIFVFEVTVNAAQLDGIRWTLFSVNAIYFIGCFYLFFVLVFQPFFGKNWYKFWMYLTGLALVVLVFKTLFDYHVIGKSVYAGTTNQTILLYDRITTQFWAYITFEVWRLSNCFIYLTLYWYGKQVAEGERQKHAMEKQLYQAQIAHLRSQINPHFLFNALNYFYAQTKPTQPQVAEGITHLSDIIRYSLQEMNPEGRVPLQSELEQIDHFVEIYRLRFGDTLQVFVETIGQPQAIHQIVPLSLLTLVENAFKYGDLHNPDNPIVIHTDIKPNAVVFQIQNKIKAASTINPLGIGLQNLNQRLDYAYGSHYQLKIHHDTDDYITELILPF
jgi:two-component system, LytTR family, sensor kinase